MSKRIVIEPVTRIEGHGKVTIHLDDQGEVSDAKFHIVEFRGFEKFCEGRLFWEMPIITPRTCGICPVSHHLASSKATDAILGVEITPTAKKLRELLQMGQYIQSHALHFFHLASPDLLLGMDADPAIRNVIGVIGANPELATKGVLMRKFGQEIIQTLGGKKVHPVFCVPGGVNKALHTDERDKIRKGIDSVIADYQVAVNLIKGYLAQHLDLANSFAVFPSGYMGLVDAAGNLKLYDGKIRLKDQKGNILEDQIAPKDYLSIVEEKVENWSYMKFPYYKKWGHPRGMYRVGPLARVNMADGFTTPLANKELKEFKKLSKDGIVEGSLYYHYARMIEGLYAAEKTKELVEDNSICDTDIRVSSNKLNEQGVGIIEAPRGTLIHHYQVDSKGTIRKVNMIVSTGHNNMAMNKAVESIARSYIKGGKLTEGILNRVEASIRCYDPCLSCATHALGQMSLVVQTVSANGEVIEEIRRG